MVDYYYMCMVEAGVSCVGGTLLDWASWAGEARGSEGGAGQGG